MEPTENALSPSCTGVETVREKVFHQDDGWQGVGFCGLVTIAAVAVTQRTSDPWSPWMAFGIAGAFWAAFVVFVIARVAVRRRVLIDLGLGSIVVVAGAIEIARIDAKSVVSVTRRSRVKHANFGTRTSVASIWLVTSAGEVLLLHSQSREVLDKIEGLVDRVRRKRE